MPDINPKIFDALYDILSDENRAVGIRLRSQIVYLYLKGFLQVDIAKHLNVARHTVLLWVSRFKDNQEEIEREAEIKDIKDLEELIVKILKDRDKKRSIYKITPDEEKKIISIYSQPPRNFGVDRDQWSYKSLYKYLLDEKIVDNLSLNALRTIIKSSR